MKIFALYLPQFHEIPENNEWWGEGFTEWNNVRSATPLFKSHIQPKHPLNNNYYNLMDKNTVVWQTQLMKEYGISGMIYYHYYFNGRKLLEKPAENLLKWKDVDQPFFFCWANHTWNRSWQGTKEVLVEQVYGGEKEWREHFEYLLQFFRDDRYEKIDNCPVLMIYDSTFTCKNQMIDKFNEWCKEAGFKGIHVVEECFGIEKESIDDIRSKASKCTKHIYLTEPLVGRKLFVKSEPRLKDYFRRILNKLNQKGIIKYVIKYDGNAILSNLISQHPHGKDIIPGLFFEWDNTPRHKNRGFIITPVKKETVMHYLDSIKDSDYMIINAWNEWCEGMMLEPTQEYGYRYLEWIREWKQCNE